MLKYKIHTKSLVLHLHE